VCGHFFVCDVDAWFVPAAACDSGLQIVRDHDLRQSLEEFKRAEVRADPVLQILRPRDVGERVVAGSEHGHEELCLPDFARRRILNRDCGARVIDEQLFARPVLLPQNDFLLLSPALV
jgi:hypothetical protein